MRKSKKQISKEQMFLKAVFGKDSHGEYLEHNTAIGKVKDYSPWVIAEYKQFMNIEN